MTCWICEPEGGCLTPDECSPVQPCQDESQLDLFADEQEGAAA